MYPFLSLYIELISDILGSLYKVQKIYEKVNYKNDYNKCLKVVIRGDMAGHYILWEQGVAGSNPATPTSLNPHNVEVMGIFLFRDILKN